MITSEEVRSVTFKKSMSGYRTEDVDAFLEQVAASMEKQAADAKDLEAKLLVLAQKVEEYRGQEETLKSALINAQKLGEDVIREGKAKADGMVREASIRAQRIIEATNEREAEEKEKLHQLEAEISNFKNSILGLYQTHIESLSAIDSKVSAVNEEVFGGDPDPAGQKEITGELVEASSAEQNAD